MSGYYGNDEKRWRHALELIGRPAVEDMLHRHPGNPQDEIFDLPLHPPFPTRDFCLQWCTKSAANLTRGYARAYAVIGLLVVVAVSYASCSISQFLNPPPTVSGATLGSARRGGGITGPASSMQPPTAQPTTGTTNTGTSSGATSTGTTGSGTTSTSKPGQGSSSMVRPPPISTTTPQ
jgi:hypothetical protein